MFNAFQPSALSTATQIEFDFPETDSAKSFVFKFRNDAGNGTVIYIGAIGCVKGKWIIT